MHPLEVMLFIAEILPHWINMVSIPWPQVIIFKERPASFAQVTCRGMFTSVVARASPCRGRQTRH